MKITIFDQDVELAARYAVMFTTIIDGCKVSYTDAISDPVLGQSTLVIADPSAMPTKVWIEQFRSLHGNVPLMIISFRKDLVAGTRNDGCWAYTKPVDPQDLVQLVVFVQSGKPLTSHLFGAGGRVC